MLASLGSLKQWFSTWGTHTPKGTWEVQRGYTKFKKPSRKKFIWVEFFILAKLWAETTLLWGWAEGYNFVLGVHSYQKVENPYSRSSIFTEPVDLPDISALTKALGCSTENVLPFLEIAQMAVCTETFQISQPYVSRFTKIIIHNILETSSDSETQKTVFKVLANMFYSPCGAELMFKLPIFDFLDLTLSNQKGLASLFSNYVVFSCQPSQVKFYQQYLQVILISFCCNFSYF